MAEFKIEVSVDEHGVVSHNFIGDSELKVKIVELALECVLDNLVLATDTHFKAKYKGNYPSPTIMGEEFVTVTMGELAKGGKG